MTHVRETMLRTEFGGKVQEGTEMQRIFCIEHTYTTDVRSHWPQ